MTSNVTAPSCVVPFLLEDDYPATGGFIDGRFCSSVLGPSCCLPCPQTEWLYPDNFDTLTKSASWVNVVGLVCCIFLLSSYAFLPVAKTHRHYLSICLAIALILMQMGFIVPLGARPQQCFNDITPNDMQTSAACAISGAFLLFGGWCAVMWIFLRALALHLQICWQLVLGKSFMWGAIASGWGIPAVGVTIALIFSGVSFRFGDTCHINHKNSLADFWIPLCIFGGFTLIIQLATFGYCIKVYLTSLNDDATTTQSSGLPSYAASARGTVTPRQAYRRVRRVLELQWRGIVIVFIIVADVIFFSVVFVYLDSIEQNILHDPVKAVKWLTCLVEAQGHKESCTALAQHLVLNEATVMAVLILLSANGIWLLFLLGRFSMVTGWIELVKGKVKPDTDFVSADVGRFKDPGSYEMLGRTSDKTPEPTFSPVATLSPSVQGLQKNGRETPDYFGREARYKSPSRSFSAPKAPQTIQPWDPTKSHAAPTEYYIGMDPLAMNKI